jgi:hypothetical protein
MILGKDRVRAGPGSLARLKLSVPSLARGRFHEADK